MSNFSNQVLINYGNISLASAELNWTQPVLTQNGTLGGDHFAVYCAQVKQGATYQAFDNDINTAYVSSIFPQSTANHITVYNPIPIKVSVIECYNFTGQYATAGYISYSDDNSNWTQVATFSGLQPYWNDINVNSSSFHKYWKITIDNSTAGGLSNMRVVEFKLNATYLTSRLNSIVLPMSYNNYYSCALSYVGGNSGTVYISEKTNSQIKLAGVDDSVTSANYITVGY